MPGTRDGGVHPLWRDGKSARSLKDHPQKKSRIARERNEEKRQAFREAVEAIESKDLVFIDESGFSLSLYQHYGWAARKERLVEAVPFNRGKNLSVLGALGLQGMLSFRHKPGAMKREDVEAFLREDVLPSLLAGSVLVLDNARIHHGGRIRAIVEEAGCSVLYLPPYSPDFSPIELAWGWVKNRVRQRCPRDDKSRIAAVEESVQALPAAFAPHWFRNCGVQC
jgi:transposase